MAWENQAGHHITHLDDEMCGAFFDDTAASSSFKGICEQRHQRGDAVIASICAHLVDCMQVLSLMQLYSSANSKPHAHRKCYVQKDACDLGRWVDAMSSINQCHKPSA